MKRLFTLLLVFFFGIVVGAAFFTEDAPARMEDQTASEVLTQTLYNVLGTTRETAAEVANEIRPHLSQLSYLTNEEIREYYNTLSLKYHLPALSDEQLENLTNGLHSIGNLASSGTSKDAQAEGGTLGRASELLDAGAKIISALQRIIRITGSLLQEATGRVG